MQRIGEILGRSWSRTIPTPLLRRGLLGLAIVAALAALAVLALPFAASTRIVRDRIALEMSAWSGFAVSIDEAPDIEIWPDFRAVLSDVTMRPYGAADAAPVIAAERVEIELSPLAALGGDVVFTAANFVRPTIRLERSASGGLVPPWPGGGRMARAIDAARRAVAENSTSPDASNLPADAFGTVAFSDGRIVLATPAGETDVVTGLTGTLDWSALDRPAFAQAAGVWRGEGVTLDASASSPLLLFGGGPASVSVTMRSDPASLRFDGIVGLASNAFFKGKGRFMTPSLTKLLEWSHAEPSAGLPAGTVGIEAEVTGDAQRVRFESATVFLDDNPGQGALDLILTGRLPVVSGTLAFETLDLRSFLSAFTPLDPGGSGTPGVVDAGFAERINLDLRLSAAKATAGKVELADVAATARVNESMAAFDISDSAGFGGTLQAGLSFARRGEDAEVEMRLLASDVDAAALGAAAGLGVPMPAARGNISVILKGPGEDWHSILEQADGSVTASFGAGTLAGFDFAAFLDRARQGGFFALADVAKGELPLEGLEVKASVADGVARIERAELRSSRGRILVSGIARYAGRGLALSGTIEPPGQQAAPTAAQRFFVGGSWNAPYVSAVPGTPQE